MSRAATFEGAPCKHGHTERYRSRPDVCAVCARETARKAMQRYRKRAARPRRVMVPDGRPNTSRAGSAIPTAEMINEALRLGRIAGIIPGPLSTVARCEAFMAHCRAVAGKDISARDAQLETRRLLVDLAPEQRQIFRLYRGKGFSRAEALEAATA